LLVPIFIENYWHDKIKEDEIGTRKCNTSMYARQWKDLKAGNPLRNPHTKVTLILK
jgi:hypothetical protein